MLSLRQRDNCQLNGVNQAVMVKGVRLPAFAWTDCPSVSVKVYVMRVRSEYEAAELYLGKRGSCEAIQLGRERAYKRNPPSR